MGEEALVLHPQKLDHQSVTVLLCTAEEPRPMSQGLQKQASLTSSLHKAQLRGSSRPPLDMACPCCIWQCVSLDLSQLGMAMNWIFCRKEEEMKNKTKTKRKWEQNKMVRLAITMNLDGEKPPKGLLSFETGCGS